MEKVLIGNSKTLSFNVLIPVAMMACSAFGLQVPEEIWIAVATIGNFVLRFFTSKGLTDK